ncbi:hypothetical protein OsI_20045 [Oryza sativa Indica Group]|uniref:Uncharacterized protein n=1 Tax=Oryza sativa subsp. indica TaxID=39946 RepID=B8AYH8_ORYSI|nr:hypothetical protein OsI_20045 [Oryza sativa Indica Group]
MAPVPPVSLHLTLTLLEASGPHIEYGFDTSYYANRTVRARVRRHAPLAKTLPKLIQLKGNQTQFTSSFANAMVKMGNLRGGYPGEVCDNCRRVRT